MDTGPASRSETFRISGERGRVYVGTFRIPYSRGLSLARSLLLSAISRPSSFSFSSSSSSPFHPLPRPSRRRSHPVRKEEARSKMRYSRRAASDAGAVAVAVAIGWLASWLMVPMLLMAPPHAMKNAESEPEEERERGEGGREQGGR